MTVVALTTFLTVLDANGTVQHRHQNSKVGASITLDGQPYTFLSFAYNGAAMNRTGDNLEAELLLATNQLSMSYAAEAVQKKWTIRVTSCSMKPSDFSVARKLAVEVWLAASMSYDQEKITVLLSSGIDAVGASAPSRTLSSQLVGQLPLTASISNR